MLSSSLNYHINVHSIQIYQETKIWRQHSSIMIGQVLYRSWKSFGKVGLKLTKGISISLSIGPRQSISLITANQVDRQLHNSTIETYYIVGIFSILGRIQSWIRIRYSTKQIQGSGSVSKLNESATLYFNHSKMSKPLSKDLKLSTTDLSFLSIYELNRSFV